MPADPNQIIVATGQIPQFRVNHRDFPDLQADGESPAIAAANLALHLEREIDAALDELHRKPLQQALADVRAYIDRAR